jgi:hypothetical protein
MVVAQIHDADDRPELRQHIGYRHLRTETVRWIAPDQTVTSKSRADLNWRDLKAGCGLMRG